MKSLLVLLIAVVVRVRVHQPSNWIKNPYLYPHLSARMWPQLN